MSVLVLKKALFDAYGGFADKRIKNLEKGNLFIVDDRRPGDLDARGQLFLWFCTIWVETLDPEAIQVTLRGGIPRSQAVSNWVKQHGGEETEAAIQVRIVKGTQASLADLANAMRAIVKPGAKYAVAAYKYVCPRTADSLDRLRKVLDQSWIS